MKRVALFGGTFDPVHRGHLFIAERARDRCRLDEVIFMPCRESPHKTGQACAPAEDRVAMLRLATKDLPWAVVSRWEIERPGPSYSWQTAEHWREEALGAEDALHWILGADQWGALSRWARIDRLAELVTFIVFPREGWSLEQQAGLRALFLDDVLTVSATNIRTRRARGESIEHDVHPSVATYVVERRLYDHGEAG